MTDVPTKNDKPNLSIVPKLPPPVTDIPAQLRAMAEQIEAGEYGEAHAAVLVLTHGKRECDLTVKAWGDLGDSYRASGIVMAAAIQLSNYLDPADGRHAAGD